MSTKRKKNSINPAGKLVKFIKIHDDSPWEQDYYMCGMCGHAISFRTIERHAKESHGASRVELISVESGDERLPADNTTGKSVAHWCDNCTHHVSYHKLEVPHVCAAEECSCPGYDSMDERDKLGGGILRI